MSSTSLDLYFNMMLQFNCIIVDVDATINNLRKIHESNINFRRYACCYSKLKKMHESGSNSTKYQCTHTSPYACDTCTCEDLNNNGINDVSQSFISSNSGLSWIPQKTISNVFKNDVKSVPIDMIFLYAYMSGKPLSEIIVLQHNYKIDEHGKIIRSVDTSTDNITK